MGWRTGLCWSKFCSAHDVGGQSYALAEVHEPKFPQVLSREFTPGGRAAVQPMALNAIQEAMDSLGIALPVTAFVRSLHQQMADSRHADEDHSAIVRRMEQAARGSLRRWRRVPRPRRASPGAGSSCLFAGSCPG